MVQPVELSQPGVVLGPTKAPDKSGLARAIGDTINTAKSVYETTRLNKLQQGIQEAETGLLEDKQRDQAVVDAFQVLQNKQAEEPENEIPELVDLEKKVSKIKTAMQPNIAGNAQKRKDQIFDLGNQLANTAPWLRGDIDKIIAKHLSSGNSRSLIGFETSEAQRLQQIENTKVATFAAQEGINLAVPGAMQQVKELMFIDAQNAREKSRIELIKAQGNLQETTEQRASRGLISNSFAKVGIQLENSRRIIDGRGGIDNFTNEEKTNLVRGLQESVQRAEAEARLNAGPNLDLAHLNDQKSAMNAYIEEVQKWVSGESEVEMQKLDVNRFNNKAVVAFNKVNPRAMSMMAVYNAANPTGNTAMGTTLSQNIDKTMAKAFRNSFGNQADGVTDQSQQSALRKSVMEAMDGVDEVDVPMMQAQGVNSAFNTYNARQADPEQRQLAFKTAMDTLVDINSNPQEYPNKTEVYGRYIQEMGRPQFWESIRQQPEAGQEAAESEVFSMFNTYMGTIKDAVDEVVTNPKGISVSVGRAGNIEFKVKQPSADLRSQDRLTRRKALQEVGAANLSQAKAEVAKLNRTVSLRFNEALRAWKQFVTYDPAYLGVDPYDIIANRFTINGTKPAWAGGEANVEDQ